MLVGSIYNKKIEKRICQGDIFKDVSNTIFNRVEDGLVELTIAYPYIVVVSQDCDLQWDYNNRNSLENRINEDRFLQTILLVPIFIAEDLRNGEHLNEYGIKRACWNRGEWNKIKHNENKRFHHLEKDRSSNLADLCLDFQQFFTISRETLYTQKNEKYLTSIKELFREDLSLRFAQYISRIGLPDISRLDADNLNVDE